MIQIERMGASHIGSFHQTLDAVARERKYLTLLEAPPLAQTREFVLDRIARGEPNLVAIAGDQVVGWCDIARHFFPAHAHRGSLGMGLLPAWRGQGIGRRLIDGALALAWDTGFTRVELSVHADNAPAISLYQKVGFLTEGVVRDAVRVDGDYRDAVAMAILRR